MLRESSDLFGRVRKEIGEPPSDLDRITSDPEGEAIPIGAHDAHAMEQRIRGQIDWYLVGLKATESDEIEAAKAVELDELCTTLNDVY